MSQGSGVPYNPAQVGVMIHGTALHNANVSLSETMIRKSGSDLESEAYRNKMEALKADPEMARRLARNRWLLVVIPAVLGIAFIVFIYLL